MPNVQHPIGPRTRSFLRVHVWQWCLTHIFHISVSAFISSQLRASCYHLEHRRRNLVGDLNHRRENEWYLCQRVRNHKFEIDIVTAGGAGLAQWWERSPSTNVSRVRFPDSASYVVWVCWFSTLLREVFLRVLRFSPLVKNHYLIWLDLICN